MVFRISKIHTNADFTFSNNNLDKGAKIFIDYSPKEVYTPKLEMNNKTDSFDTTC